MEQHRRKYVMMVLSMAALCNIPYFFVFYLSRDDKDNKVYFRYDRTNFGQSEYQLVYHNIMHLAFTVCFPIIILLIVTVKMMVVLRIKQRNMQNSNTLNLSINTVLIIIVLTFIICQLPLLANSILHVVYGSSGAGARKCGNVLFYLVPLEMVFLALNSAARPFIYMMLKNHFAWPLRYTLRRAGTIEMISM